MASIQLKTAIPGPKSQALMKERQTHVARGPFHTTPIFVTRAQGALLEDADGNKLIDFAGGIGVVNTGHCAEGVVRAIQEQANQLLHGSFNVTPYENYIRLCEKLNRATPGTVRQEKLPRQQRRGSRRKRDQDRARAHQTPGRHLLRPRLSWPHLHGDDADLEIQALQGGLRSL